MKKLLSLILIAGTCSFMSCGPSKEEQAEAEKLRQDSIAAVAAAEAQKAMEDSMAMVQKAMQDSINAANQAIQDSMAAQMSKLEKKMNAKPPVKTNKQKEEEDRKSQSKEKG